jgi:two-component sensor histidine kinase
MSVFLLARCNKEITKSNNGGMRLRNIIDVQLVPFASRATSHGPEVTVSPQQGQNVSLVIHELVTNAVKYGALKGPSGKIEITWLVTIGSDRMLQLKWQERHGPAVVSPLQTGFGTLLLKATFPNAKIDYAPEGLCLQVEFPAVGDPATL